MPPILTVQDVYNELCRLYQYNEPTDIMRRDVNWLILERRYTPLQIIRCLVYNEEVLHEQFITLKYGLKFIDRTMPESNRYWEKLEQEKAIEEARGKQGARKAQNIHVIHVPPQPPIKRRAPQIDIGAIKIPAEGEED